MLITTVLLFALAAILGAILLSKVFQDKETPKPVVYAHGLAAASALVLLFFAWYNNGDSLLLTSLLIFVIAATGGFILFGKDVTGKPLPNWLAAVHALAAVTGFVILLIVVFL
ncbi:MAG: hypothetical protein WEA56_16030 [Balneolaceae bacterium]